jgi:hypothetical protein
VLFTIIFGLTNREHWHSSITVLSLETGQRRTLIEPGTCGRYIKSGHLVYAREGKLLAAPFDLDKLRLTGPPAVVLQGVATTVVEKAQFGVSENGTLVYAPGSASESGRRLVWVDRLGSSYVSDGTGTRV